MMGRRVAEVNIYALRHLVYHLSEDPGRHGDLDHLLRLETPERRNRWYEARESMGERVGYLEDIDLAWQVAAGRRESPGSLDVGRLVRYSLASVFVRKLAQEIAPEFLALALEQGELEPERAIALAWREGGDGPASALSLLVPHLDDQNLDRVLEIVQATEGPDQRTAIRLRLVTVLPPNRQEAVWAEGCEGLRKGTDLRLLSPVLRTLARSSLDLGAPPFNDLVAAVGEIVDPRLRSGVLLGILPLLTSQEEVQELAEAAWEAAREMDKPGERLAVLVELLAFLEGATRDAAMMQAFEDRAGIDMGSAPSNTYSTERLVTRRRDLGPHPYSQPDPLVRIAPLVSPEQRDTILCWVEQISDASYRARTLARLARWLPDQMIENLIGGSASLDDESRAWTLALVAPHVSGSLVMHAVNAGRTIQKPLERVRAIHAFLPHLDPDRQSSLFQELIQAIGMLDNVQLAMEAVAFLLAVLQPDPKLRLLEWALNRMQRVQDRGMWWRSQRFDGLLVLIPFLPREGALLDKAFRIAAELSDVEHRAQSLVQLAPRLRPPLIRRAWDLAMELPERGRLGQSRPRAQAIKALAPVLTPDLHDALVNAVLAFASRKDASDLMAGILPLLPPERRHEVMNRAVGVILQLQSAKALKPLRRRLARHSADGDFVPSTSAVVHLAVSPRTSDMDSTWKERRLAEVAEALGQGRGRVLATLLLALPRLPQWLRHGPGRWLIRLCRRDDDTDALTLALPFLPPSVFDDALDTIRGWPTSKGAPLLAALAGRLPEDQRKPVQDEAWVGASEVEFIHKVALMADLAGQGYRQPQLAGRALDSYLGMNFMSRVQLDNVPRRLQRAVAAYPVETMEFWTGALRRLARESAQDFVYRQLDIIPVTLALVPAEQRSEAVREILRALDDIERWWP